MQLVVTVTARPERADAHSWDVVLDVHKETPLSAVVAAAATADGQELADENSDPTEEAVPTYLDGRFVDPATTVAQAGLVSGQRLGLDAPTGPDDLAWQPARIGVDWLEVHAVSGPDAGRIWPVRFGSYGIGPAPGAWIRLDGDENALQETELTIDAQGEVWLSGLGGTRLTQTGITLADETATVQGGRLSLPEPPRDEIGSPDPDYRRAVEDAAIEYAEMMRGHQGARRWPVGMDLAVGDTLLRLVHRFDPDAAISPSQDQIGRDFNRPPRLVPPLMQAPVKLPVPPKAPQRRRIPLLMMLAPMVLGLSFVFLFHSYFFLLISLMTPVLMLANWVQDRRSGARQYRKDCAEYRKRRTQAEQAVFTTVNEERVARCSASPDPALVGLIANGPGSRLWERRRTDPDFLVLRVGTVDQASLMELDDPARDETHRRYRWNVPDVPVGVSLTERGVIGVAGSHEATGSIVRWLLAQAATLHSPRDLRLFLLTAPGGTGGRAQERWSWARWLPQARPFLYSSGNPLVTFGNDPETVAHRVGELTKLIKGRQEARGSRMGTVLFAEPDVLVVMDGARLLRDVPGIMSILVEGPAVRVFTIAIDDLERLLPEECTAVVRTGHDGLTLRQVDTPDVAGIRPDDVGLEWCEDVARSLSSLRDVSPDEVGGLPETVRLLDLLRAEPPSGTLIADRWARRPASTVFPLGRGFDGPVLFDLVRDGPHGLIAGTTGSGKSELLQSMVASLAALNRPDELVFVLVDYKGGSAFHSCVDLPHTLGMVTDLDEALSLRALESLAAELRRREQMLAEVGAKDLPEYRAHRARNPQLPAMPRLLLVIDEFATMARETPAFVPGLVSIAQRGRSLGIHLILATQRPAGVVTSDIKANTNLRIALRVTDVGESQDVIDTSDAAHISTRTPGRALARLGHRSSMPFQTAYVGGRSGETDGQDAEPEPVGAPAADVVTWGSLGRPPRLSAADDDLADMSLLPEKSSRTDLDDLVDAISEATALTGITAQPSPWLPALGARVLLDELDALGEDRARPRFTPDDLRIAPFARADLPAQQTQRTVSFDPSEDGHLFIVGAPRAGRSQVLRTIAGSLARANSSSEIQMYGIDAAGSALGVLAELPHCGGVVPRTDLERLSRLVTWLADELERRQQLLAQHSSADLTELRVKLRGGPAPAHLIVFVDGWDTLATLITDHDGGSLYGTVQEIIREGAGAGIHMIMTSERVLAAGKIAAMSENKLIMRMTDRSDLTLIGVPAQRLPTVIPPGRAWRAQDCTELQIALLSPDPSGQAQVEALRAIGQEAAQRDALLAAARRPYRIGPLPSRIAFPDLFARWPEAERRPLRALIGIGGDTSLLAVDFTGRAHAFLVAGPAGSGRSNVLATLGISLLAGGTSLVVLAPRESPLRRLTNHSAVQLITSLQPEPETLRAMLAAIPDSGTVLLIDDVDLFVPGNPIDPVLREAASVGRDRRLGIAFAGTAEALTGHSGPWLSEAKRSRQGVLLAPQNSLEGDLLGIRLPYSQMRTPVRPGRGYTTLGAAPGRAQTIAIPHTTLK